MAVNRYWSPMPGGSNGFTRLLLLADEGPNLVKLYMPGLQPDHHSVVEFRAALAHTDAQPHNRIAVNVSQTLGCANADALSERRNSSDLFVEG